VRKVDKEILVDEMNKKTGDCMQKGHKKMIYLFYPKGRRGSGSHRSRCIDQLKMS
jgi:hypothetical protein